LCRIIGMVRLPIVPLVVLPLAFASWSALADSAPLGVTAGSYSGVVQGGLIASTGFARATINARGTGSLALKFGQSPQKAVKLSFSSGHLLGASGKIRVDLVPGSNDLAGTISDSGEAIAVDLTLNVAPADAAPLSGQYTVVLEDPSAGAAFSEDVAGFGTIRLNTNGSFSFTGLLSDGSAITQGGALNSGGQWQLMATTQGGGTLSGQVTFADVAETDCAGAIVWKKPASKKDGTPEQDVTLSLVGSRFDSTLLWNADPFWALNASDDGGATSDFSVSLQPSGNLLRAIGAHGASVFLDNTSGYVFGIYGSGAADLHGMLGVAYQKTGAAFGLTVAFPTIKPGASVGHAVPNVALSSLTKASSWSSIIGPIKNRQTGMFAIEGQETNTVNNTGSGAVTTVSAGSLTISGSTGYTGGTTVNTGGGAVFIGPIGPTGGTQDGGIVKTGSGTLTLNSGNTSTGTTTVGSGTLTMNSGATVGGTLNGGITTVGGGTLTLTGVVPITVLQVPVTVPINIGTLTSIPTSGATISAPPVDGGTLTLSGGSVTTTNGFSYSSGATLSLGGSYTTLAGSGSLSVVNGMQANIFALGSFSRVQNLTIASTSIGISIINQLPPTATVVWQYDGQPVSYTAADLRAAISDLESQNGAGSPVVISGITFYTVSDL